MAQIDNYHLHDPGMSGVARVHYPITPDDNADLPRRPRALFVKTTGTVTIVDQEGTEETYDLPANFELHISPVRVKATGTTATVVGWE